MFQTVFLEKANSALQLQTRKQSFIGTRKIKISDMYYLLYAGQKQIIYCGIDSSI
jgi:hypothetical protein